VRLAQVQIRMKNYDAGLASLRSAVNLAPDNTTVSAALAEAYVVTARVDAGLAEARRLQKERADKAVGYVLEGELLTRQQHWNEAATAFRAALARNPSNYIVARLQTALKSAGKTDEANAVSQKWLKDHPRDVMFRAHLAQQAIIAKDFRAAIPHLRAALEVEPDNALLLNNLAWSLEQLGDHSGIDFARRAYELAPGVGSINDTYGWLLVQKGDTARGIELLRQAASLTPADADIRMHLAQALLKTGDKAGARTELEALRKPDTPPAVRMAAEKLLSDMR